jgi:hypothetical protein
MRMPMIDYTCACNRFGGVCRGTWRIVVGNVTQSDTNITLSAEQQDSAVGTALERIILEVDEA